MVHRTRPTEEPTLRHHIGRNLLPLILFAILPIALLAAAGAYAITNARRVTLDRVHIFPVNAKEYRSLGGDAYVQYIDRQAYLY